MGTRSTLLVAGLVVALAGCASGARSADPGAPRGTPNLITSEEIARTRAANVLELVNAVRPNWLAQRGLQSFTDPTVGQVMVYLDGSLAGGPDYLRQVATTQLARIEYLSGIDAAARYGLNHSGGAILIHTLR